MIFSHKHIVASIIGAGSTPSSIARQVAAIVDDVACKDSVKASSSDQVAVGLQHGAECSIASSSFRARAKEDNTDMGLLSGCAENKKCVMDKSSSRVAPSFMLKKV
jgi:hypothetical protein